MENWYLFSVLALILLGTQRFLYKVTAERGCSSGLTTAIFMATVTLLSTAVYVVSGATIDDYTVLITLALVNSSAFAISTISNIEALRHLPAAITFPLTRLSLVLVILVSVIYFDEQLSAQQWFGILLGFAVVILLAKESKQNSTPEENHRCGFLFIGICILCGAIASISSKLAAVSTDTAGFMALTYLFATVFSLLINKRWGQETPREKNNEAIMIGVMMGVLNFFGFYAFLTALASGPLSSIALITGMHFVIAIILSVMLYHEQMTLRRGLSLALTLLAIFLLRA
ncbi:MAG: EamA family transporter [Desulfuromonas sp.]|nr:EamA family transporter [Desulfuromonas sp.]